MRRSYIEIGTTLAAAILSFGAVALNAPNPVTTVLAVAMFTSLGYVWVKILSGHCTAGLERLTLAIGLAVSVPVLGGLVLQLAGIPLHRVAWAALLSAFILIGDVVLVFHERSRSPIAASARTTRLRLPILQTFVYGLAVVIAAGAVGLAAVGAASQHYPGFTELWLTSEGKSTTRASLGVSNHEGSTKKYKLVLISNKHMRAIYITLPNGQTWQEGVPTNANHVTTANLYLLPDMEHPYRHVQTSFLC